MAKSPNNLPENVLEAVQHFADEDEAIQFVAEMRWPEGQQICPKCGSIGEHYFAHPQAVEMPRLLTPVLRQGRHRL